jgi:hypothetical protein
MLNLLLILILAFFTVTWFFLIKELLQKHQPQQSAPGANLDTSQLKEAA